MLMLVALLAVGQNTTRRNLHVTKAKTEASVLPADTTVTDSVAISRLVRLSGYAKTLTSNVETIMLTNLSRNDTLRRVSLSLDYRTLQGRQLTQRTVILDTIVPPRQTRAVSFPTWDRQHIYHYKSNTPARRVQRARAFDVTIRPVSIITNK